MVFFMASPYHPFIKILVDKLPLFNRNFLLPYATVMFSTGCMYISAQYSLSDNRCHLKLLDYKQHHLHGRISTPLFHHYGSSSWHSNDALLIRTIDHIFQKLLHYEKFVLLILLIFITFLYNIASKKGKKNLEEKENILLNENSFNLSDSI